MCDLASELNLLQCLGTAQRQGQLGEGSWLAQSPITVQFLVHVTKPVTFADYVNIFMRDIGKQRRIIGYNIQFRSMYLIRPVRFTAQRINTGCVVYACGSFQLERLHRHSLLKCFPLTSTVNVDVWFGLDMFGP